MAQLRDGTANVTNGGQDVTFTGADLTGVTTEWLFYVEGDTDPVYTIVAVFPGEDPPRITLSTDYQGITNATAGYALTRDFTPTWSLPLLYPGDIATRQLINRILAIIDPILGTGDGGGGNVTISQYQIVARLAAGTGAAIGVGPSNVSEDSPASGDFLLGWNSSNVLVKYNVGNLPSSGGGALAIEDDGALVLSTAARLNFAGAGVTVANAGSNEALITITGGAAGSEQVTSVKTSNYNAVAGDVIPTNSAGGGFTIFLPAATEGVSIKVEDRTDSWSTANVILDPAGTDTIEGFTSLNLDGGSAIALRYDALNDNWYCINTTGPDSSTIISPDAGNTLVDGLMFWSGTQAAYNALTPDANTIYFIES